MGQVVVTDGEAELVVAVVLAKETIEEPHGGDSLLCGECKGGVGSCEECFAEVASGGCPLAEMVVSDEEARGIAVVDDVADGVVESYCGINAAIGHEVVDVVDDE